MKLLIFSDVHRNKKRLEAILEEHQDAEYTISLGDTELKCKFLEDKDIVAIRGNYPFDAGFADEHVMTIEGKRFLFMHGHKYRVQRGIERLYYKVREVEADFTFYGHTHVASFDEVENAYLINPGAIHKSRSELPESYMTVVFIEKEIVLSWLDAANHALLKEIRVDR